MAHTVRSIIIILLFIISVRIIIVCIITRVSFIHSSVYCDGWNICLHTFAPVNPTHNTLLTLSHASLIVLLRHYFSHGATLHHRTFSRMTFTLVIYFTAFLSLYLQRVGWLLGPCIFPFPPGGLLIALCIFPFHSSTSSQLAHKATPTSSRVSCHKVALGCLLIIMYPPYH